MASTTTKVSPDSLMNGHTRPRRKPHRISTHGGGARKSSGKRNRREAQRRQHPNIVIGIVIKEKKMEKAMETDIETERKVTKTERRGPHRNGEAYKKKQKQLLLIRKYTACLNAESLGPGHGRKYYGRNPKKAEGTKVQQRTYLFL